MDEKNEFGESNEVHITHTFNAPRKVVFKAWTDQNQLEKWFAPDDCTIQFKEIDVRNGGSFHSCISNPEFGECWCKGVYSEVVFPERIVFSSIIADENGNTMGAVEAGMDPDWPQETKVTVTFEEVDGKTKVTLHQTVSQSLATKTGAYPSWINMLERLDKLVNKN